MKNEVNMYSCLASTINTISAMLFRVFVIKRNKQPFILLFILQRDCVILCKLTKIAVR